MKSAKQHNVLPMGEVEEWQNPPLAFINSLQGKLVEVITRWIDSHAPPKVIRLMDSYFNLKVDAHFIEKGEPGLKGRSWEDIKQALIALDECGEIVEVEYQ